MARRCPAWRRREPGLRLLHGTWEGECRYCPSRRKGSGWREGVRPAAETARRRVPSRHALADRPVVALMCPETGVE